MSSNVLSTASPESVALYHHLVQALRPLGPFKEEVKKTSVHLSRNSAFVGVHFRKSHLLVTIKSAQPIESSRIVKTEQVSRNRWHCESKVAAPGEVDAELLGWAEIAFGLCA